MNSKKADMSFQTILLIIVILAGALIIGFTAFFYSGFFPNSLRDNMCLLETRTTQGQLADLVLPNMFCATQHVTIYPDDFSKCDYVNKVYKEILKQKSFTKESTLVFFPSSKIASNYGVNYNRMEDMSYYPYNLKNSDEVSDLPYNYKTDLEYTMKSFCAAEQIGELMHRCWYMKGAGNLRLSEQTTCFEVDIAGTSSSDSDKGVQLFFRDFATILAKIKFDKNRNYNEVSGPIDYTTAVCPNFRKQTYLNKVYSICRSGSLSTSAEDFCDEFFQGVLNVKDFMFENYDDMDKNLRKICYREKSIEYCDPVIDEIMSEFISETIEDSSFSSKENCITATPGSTLKIIFNPLKSDISPYRSREEVLIYNDQEVYADIIIESDSSVNSCTRSFALEDDRSRFVNGKLCPFPVFNSPEIDLWEYATSEITV